MFFDLFDDIFLLHFPLKTAESAIQRLSLLKPHLSQPINTSSPLWE